MHTNRILPILGLALAVPMLVASMAFACKESCNKASAASASTTAVQANSQADCAAKCAAGAKAASASSCAGAKAASASSCSGAAKSVDAATAGAKGACGAECAKACCAGAAAATITYNVSGMTCMGCVKQVEAAVAKLEIDNLESVTVNLDGHNAVLTTSGPVDAIAVAAAISNAGFPAEFTKAERADAKPAPESAEKTEEPAATM